MIWVIIRECNADKEYLEIYVTIQEVDYKESYTTMSYNPALKISTLVHHPAEFYTSFTYENYILSSDDENVYIYCKDKIGLKIKINALKVTYKDGEIKYRFIEILD